MNVAATGAATAAAHAIAQALKASGAIVKLDKEEFLKILHRAEAPVLVVAKEKIMFSTRHRYLTSYKGLFFYCEDSEPLHIPGTAEVVTAEKIWIP